MKNIVRLSAILSAAVLLFCGLSSCSKKVDIEKNINFALAGDPDTLDPHGTSGTLTFQVTRSLYDTLVEPDTFGRIVPALAENWEISADNLVWTFTLRDGVTFHNGDRFTSADVKASIDRLRDPATASPKASEFSSIASIETPDDHTVILVLKEPYAPLLASLASGWGAVLPSSLINSGHNFASAPVGTGPFKLESWERAGKIILKRFDAYWMKEVPSIDTLTFHIIVENTVQAQGLLSGDLDIIFNVTPENVELLQNRDTVVFDKRLTSLVMVMAMNAEKPFLSDPMFRKAICHAIDKKTILDIAYGGGEPVTTFMDYSDPFYIDIPEPYPFDPEEALKILASVNVPKDKVFLMVLPQNYEQHVKAGQLCQEMLKNVGLNVEIELVDWSTWLSDVYSGGRYDFTVIGHTGKLDPHGRLSGYGTENTYVRWANSEVAGLVELAKTTVEFDARKKLYARLLGIMAVEVPQVYIGSSFRYVAHRSNITGFHIDPKLDSLDFRYVKVE